MAQRKSRLSLLLFVVLLSAAGLVTFGVLGLKQTAEDANDLAIREAQETAETLASSLKRTVRDKSVLNQIPTGNQFAVEGKSLVIPPSLGWIEYTEKRDQAPRLSWAALQIGNQAQRLEFVVKDPKRATDLLVKSSLETKVPQSKSFLLARAAWVAHRAKNEARRDEILVRFKSLGMPRAKDRAAVLRLKAMAHGTFDDELLGFLTGLPVDEAMAFLDGTRDRDPKKAASLANEIKSVELRRSRLRLVQQKMPVIKASTEPMVVAADNKLILYFPENDRGVGAVLSPEWLLEQLDQDRTRFYVGTDAPTQSVAAIPLVAALPTTLANGDEVGGSGWVAFILVLLSLSFLIGLFFTLKSVRTEALSAQARTEFLTSVTHELKTPLASIRLLAEMLEDNMVTDEDKKQEYFRLLSGESARLTMLIENVLDLRRMERGERAYDMRRQNVSGMIDEAIQLFAPIASRDGIKLNATLSDSEVLAQFDRGALVQVLLNLLENAKKYASSGKQVDVTGGVHEGDYRLTIRDYGPGIPAGELSAVFNRFKRGAAQSDGRIAGVGLGLYLARRIMTDHGGQLRAVLPEDGKGGACFEWSLPIGETDDGSSTLDR